MSAARQLIQEAEASGVRLFVKDGAVRFSYSGDPPSDLITRLRAEKPAIETELLGGPPSVATPSPCAVCGSDHANFGHGWSLREPEKTRWLCAECNKSSKEQH